MSAKTTEYKTIGLKELSNTIGDLVDQNVQIFGTASEGGAAVFKLDYFGGVAVLAQSPQFYKQMMVGAGYNVLRLGQCFVRKMQIPIVICVNLLVLTF